MLLTVPIAKPAGFDPDAYLREKSASFDPDAYLREKGVGFNPDAYLRDLHNKKIEQMSKNVGGGEAFLRGGAQGATLGWGDELQGVVQAAGQKVLPESLGGIDYGKSFSQLRKESRDTARNENEAAQKAHGFLYGTGEAVGGVLPTIALGGATGTLTAPAVARQGLSKYIPAAVAGLQGGVQGAGYSDADTAGGLAADTAIGGALGLAGYGAGQGVDAATRKLSGVASRRIASATQRTLDQSTKEATADVASAVGKYGGLRQTENNAILSSLELEKSGGLSAANQKALDALRASGRVNEALNESVANNLEFLGTRTPEVMAAKQSMQAMQANLPQTIATRAAELQQPQMGKDALSFAKSYAEPLVWAGLTEGAAKLLGVPPGFAEGLAGAAGIIGGRTRAGKALATRLNRPGNQIKLWGGVDSAAPALGEVLKGAVRGSSPVATDAIMQARAQAAALRRSSDSNLSDQ